MRYLLDTNVLSDARKQAHPALNAWLAAQSRADVAISVVTILEIERGILRLARRDRTAAAHLRDWLTTDVFAVFEGQMLTIDERVARAAARMHTPDPMPELDALIAATAKVHDLTLVTRNTKDLDRAGIDVLDPWSL